ncbi:MAG: LysR family transcriptional regulator [Streptomycetales bacterium]
MLDVRRLRVLLAVREQGSVASAARALAFTPPAVSQQLAALERQVGVSLVDRTGRRVRLTDAGLRLADHAERVLAQLEAAEADLASIHGRVSGPLLIGTIPTLGLALLPRALAMLRNTAPGLEPRVEQMEAESSLPALQRGAIDVALAGEYAITPRRLDPGIDRRDLLVEPLLVAVPAEHWALGPAVRLGDLRRERWLAPAVGSSCLVLLERACGVAGFEPDVVGHCDSFELALALVAVRQGVALVPEIVVSAGPHSGSSPRRSPGGAAVRLLDPVEPEVHRTLFLAARRGGSRHPAVKLLYAALRQAVDEVGRAVPGSTAAG